MTESTNNPYKGASITYSYLLNVKKGVFSSIAQLHYLGLYFRKYSTGRASRERRKMYREWHGKGLIPQGIGEPIGSLLQYALPIGDARSDWGWLNFFELVWVRLVLELRSFGYPIESIKAFKEDILRPVVEVSAGERDKLLKLTKPLIRQYYNDYCKINFTTPNENDFLKCVETYERETRRFSQFELLIHKVLQTKQSLFFYATKEYGILPHLPAEPLEPEQEKKLKVGLSQSYITISFVNLVDDFIWNKEGSVTNEAQILSSKEVKILELLRGGDIKQATIIYDDQTMQPHKAVITTNDIINIKTDSRLLLETIRSEQYKTVHLTNVNNGNMYFEKEEVIKL